MKCIVRDCVNIRKKDNNISFFPFPKHWRILQRWLEFCRIQQKYFKPSSHRICMMHFKAEDMEKDQMRCGERRILKAGAVPCLNRSLPLKVRKQMLVLQKKTKRRKARARKNQAIITATNTETTPLSEIAQNAIEKSLPETKEIGAIKYEIKETDCYNSTENEVLSLKTQLEILKSNNVEIVLKMTNTQLPELNKTEELMPETVQSDSVKQRIENLDHNTHRIAAVVETVPKIKAELDDSLEFLPETVQIDAVKQTNENSVQSSPSMGVVEKKVELLTEGMQIDPVKQGIESLDHNNFRLATVVETVPKIEAGSDDSLEFLPETVKIDSIKQEIESSIDSDSCMVVVEEIVAEIEAEMKTETTKIKSVMQDIENGVDSRSRKGEVVEAVPKIEARSDDSLEFLPETVQPDSINQEIENNVDSNLITGKAAEILANIKTESDYRSEYLPEYAIRNAEILESGRANFGKVMKLAISTIQKSHWHPADNLVPDINNEMSTLKNEIDSLQNQKTNFEKRMLDRKQKFEIDKKILRKKLLSIQLKTKKLRVVIKEIKEQNKMKKILD